MPDRYLQKGVTLVELSIVIAIMAILLAGTLGGINLLKASKLRKVATEFTDYKSSIEQFEGQYYALPGDMHNAGSYWTGSSNGDGDGSVDWDGAIAANQEDLYAWEHLTNSELISGSYTGVVKAAGTVRYELGTNSPDSGAYPEAAYVLYSLSSAVYGRLGTAIELSELTASGLPNAGGFTAREAYSIDKKLDDGVADKGNVFAYKESGASGCTDNSFSSSSGAYDLDAADQTCQLLYFYRQAPRS